MVYYKELPYGKKLIEKLRNRYVKTVHKESLENQIRQALVYAVSEYLSAECMNWHFIRLCQWTNNIERNPQEVEEAIASGDWDQFRDGAFDLMFDTLYLYVAFSFDNSNRRHCVYTVINDPFDFMDCVHPALVKRIEIKRFPEDQKADFSVDVRDYF